MKPAIRAGTSVRALFALIGVCVAALSPFLALLLRDRGFDPSQIGVVFSAMAATWMVANPLWGHAADVWIGRVRALRIAALGAATMGAGLPRTGTEPARRPPGRDRAGGLPRRRRADRRRDRARSSRTRGRAGLRTHPPVEQPRVRRRRDRLRRSVRDRGHRPGAAHLRRRHGNARSLVDDVGARRARARAERRALRLRRGGVPRLASSRAAARRHAALGHRIRRRRGASSRSGSSAEAAVPSWSASPRLPGRSSRSR